MRFRGIVTSSPECCKQRFVWLSPDRILFLAIRCHRTAEFPDILYDVSHSVRLTLRCSLLLWKEHSEIQRFVRVKISVILADERCIVFNVYSISNNQIPNNNLRKFISFTFSIRSIHPSIHLLVLPSIHACMQPSIHHPSKWVPGHPTINLFLHFRTEVRIICMDYQVPTGKGRNKPI